MEYVVVRYPRDRDVCIDGQVVGATNDLLMIEKGHHVFDLNDPKDYRPASVEKDVQNTTTVSPLVITEFRAV